MVQYNKVDLHLTNTQLKKYKMLQKITMEQMMSTDIKLSKVQINKIIKEGGNWVNY